MKSPLVFFRSVDQSLRLVWMLVAAGAVGLLALYLWSPEIAPLPPGEFNRTDVSQLNDGVVDGGQGDDFVSRPLFVEGRRPLAAVKAPVAKVVKKEPAPPPKVLENVKLLGVFSSGDAKGVILQENGGDRRRLLVGDTTGNWTLIAVEPREAVFKSGGAESRVAMGLLATGLPKVRASSRAAVTQADGAKGASEEQPEKPKNWAPSFGNLYEKRRQRKAAAEDAAAARGEPDTEKRD